MPTKVTKSASAKKPVKKVAAKPVRRTTSSAAVAKATSQQSRNKFVATMVVVAAALVAVSIGVSSYQKRDEPAINYTPTGNMYVRAADNGGMFKAGDTFKVTVLESSSQTVNAVQSAVTYPADKLKVVSVTTGSSFPQEAATDYATPGLVRVARAINTGSSAVQGEQPIVTIEFQATGEGSVIKEITVDKSSSLLVSSTSNQNILQ